MKWIELVLSAIGVVGIADVFLFRGAIGVTLSGWLRWVKK